VEPAAPPAVPHAGSGSGSDGDLDHLDEWGLGGRKFGSWITWFLVGGDLYTAYTFAAIMSIAAANLWTRNIYKEYLKRDATPAQEARQAKLASLVVKFGAVLFVLAIDPQFSIDLQLIGGVIILQTLPAIAIALYTRWLHRWALVAGWVAGMGYGLYLLWLIPNPANGRPHFGGSALTFDKLTLLGGIRSRARRCRSTSDSSRWWSTWSSPCRSHWPCGQGTSARARTPPIRPTTTRTRARSGCAR
jgi:Na+/proline symporter